MPIIVPSLTAEGKEKIKQQITETTTATISKLCLILEKLHEHFVEMQLHKDSKGKDITSSFVMKPTAHELITIPIK